MVLPAPGSTLFPYTTLFRSVNAIVFQSRLVLSWFVTVTSWTGAVADDSFSKSMRYGGTDCVAAMKLAVPKPRGPIRSFRSEEHTSELQSHSDLVCRLLLEKK